MSSAKRPGPQSAAKRLLHELATFREEGNPALLELGPASEHELTRWSAVMKGPTGSAYEGESCGLELPAPPASLLRHHRRRRRHADVRGGAQAACGSSR